MEALKVQHGAQMGDEQEERRKAAGVNAQQARDLEALGSDIAALKVHVSCVQRAVDLARAVRNRM